MKQKVRSEFGAAHMNARDAYRDVPVLKQPTWHNEVAAYFFFGGVSAGSAIIGSMAELFGGEKGKHLAGTARYVSFIALLPCPPLLIDDLGMPSRFHHMLRIFKPSSPMNLGSWALIAHGGLATLAALTTLNRSSKLPFGGPLVSLLPPRLLAALGMPAALALAGYTGVLLGTTSVPVWYTSNLLGGLFTASSMAAGSAATSLAAGLAGNSEETHEAEALIGSVFGAVELSLLVGYVVTSGKAASALFKGDARILLAGATVTTALGTFLDASRLMGKRPNKMLSALASILTLLGGAMLRWAVVRAGGKSAADREGTLQSMSPSEKNPGWGPHRQETPTNTKGDS